MVRAVLLVALAVTLAVVTSSPVTGCGGIYRSPSGHIESPNYPGPYPNMRMCTWVILAPPGQQVRLKFEQFQLEGVPLNTYCFDSVEIRDGLSVTSPPLGTYCGHDLPPNVTSITNGLWVHFRSDSTVTDRGFRASWIATAPEKKEDSAGKHAPVNLDEIERPILLPVYTELPPVNLDDIDRPILLPIPTGCGGVYRSPSGHIESPNYPKPYQNGRMCNWVIRAPLGQRVQLKFEQFQLEGDPLNTYCYDSVTIRDGLSVSSPPLGTYCGHDLPPDVTSITNGLWVYFRSDSTVTDQGFRASWIATAPVETVVEIGPPVEQPAPIEVHETASIPEPAGVKHEAVSVIGPPAELPPPVKVVQTATREEEKEDSAGKHAPVNLDEIDRPILLPVYTENEDSAGKHAPVNLDEIERPILLPVYTEEVPAGRTAVFRPDDVSSESNE